MLRTLVATLLILLVSGSTSAQTLTFGSRTTGLGNAGGFATGTGMSNSTQTSAGFGMNVIGPFSGAGFSNGGNAGINLRSSAIGGYYAPSSNFAGNVYSNVGNMVGTNYDAGLGLGGMSGANGLNNVSAFGWNNLPYNTSMYGIDPVTGLGIGNNLAYPGLGYSGLSYPGLGYSGVGYSGLGYPGLGYAAGMQYPGLALPGVAAGIGLNGFGMPALGLDGFGVPGFGLTNAGLGLPGNGFGVPYIVPGLTPGFDSVNVAATPKVQAKAGATISENALPGRRSAATADSTTAIKLQNRLATLKSPAGVKDVRVRMVGRTAVLVGNVNSQTDERLIARMVLLEPGVDNVASELSYPGKQQQPAPAK